MPENSQLVNQNNSGALRSLRENVEILREQGKLVRAETDAGPSIRFVATPEKLGEIQTQLNKLNVRSSIRNSPSLGNIEVLQIAGYAELDKLKKLVPDFSYEDLPKTLKLSPEAKAAGLRTLEEQHLHQSQKQVRWDKNFQAMFDISSWGGPQEQQQYDQLKQAFIKDFAAIAKEHPEFQPKIRFNDKEKVIEVGYAYDELKALLPQRSEVARMIPTKKSPYLDDNSIMGGEALVSPRQGDSLTKPGETKPFAYDAKHPQFGAEVRQTLQNAPERTYSLPPPQENSGNGTIGQIANQVQAAGKPLRLVVGENHNEVTARRLIIQSMPEIKKAGAALCLEHFFYDTQQPLLDKWISNPDTKAPMPLELQKYAEYLDSQYGLGKGGHTGFKEVLLAAKEHGVRVVAIDTEAVRAEVSIAGQSGNRVPNMNYVSSKIIAKEGHCWIRIVLTS